MSLDKYGRTTIRNIYLETDDYRIIRRSIEKPAYREKLRIRSYSQATPESTVFVELKKKYDKIVYKRRIALSEQDATNWVCHGGDPPCDTQISREIEYFIDFYGDLTPTVLLSYERCANFDNGGTDFRVTFDERVLARRENVNLCSEVYGEPLLPEDRVLMELKCSGGIPMWMVRALSREKIYKTSFSKYGTAYRELIFPFLSQNSSIIKGVVSNGYNI